MLDPNNSTPGLITYTDAKNIRENDVLVIAVQHISCCLLTAILTHTEDIKRLVKKRQAFVAWHWRWSVTQFQDVRISHQKWCITAQCSRLAHYGDVP